MMQLKQQFVVQTVINYEVFALLGYYAAQIGKSYRRLGMNCLPRNCGE
jgi:hypothetical protein